MKRYARLRPTRRVLGLILLAALFPSFAYAQSGADSRTAELVETCQTPSNAIVTRDGFAIVLLDRVPADEKARACIFKMQNEHFFEIMVVINDQWIERAVNGRREAQTRVEMSPARIEKVVRLLAAVRQRDTAAIEREGVLGKPYTVDQNPRRRTPESTSAFDGKSLRTFDGCTPMTPRMGGLDDVSVPWRCPKEANVPFDIVETSFRFEELAIVGVRTGQGFVAMPEAPKALLRTD